MENYKNGLSIMSECSDGDWVDYDDVNQEIRDLKSNCMMWAEIAKQSQVQVKKLEMELEDLQAALNFTILKHYN